MTYLNCPQCGLSLPIRETEDHVAHTSCPRCEGRLGLTVPMYLTDRLRPPVVARELEPV